MISVIIPVYNNPLQLAKCLRSLNGQEYKDFEVIVVDDGSDKYPVFEEKYSYFKDKLQINFFRVDHGGAPKARNFGFEKSKGDYLLFCDADMELQKDCLARMLQALNENNDRSYAYSDFKYGWKKFKVWEFDARKLKEHNYISICSLLRREDFPGFDESLEKFQDWDLWLQLLEKGKTGVYVLGVLFKAKTRGTMSKWLPKSVYKLSWLKLKEKEKYDEWKKVIFEKHNI